ncbi:LOW QUALITY PROTEIN: conserved hypothetical protein, partial [Streptomyces viridosporus ATCC 14672]
MEGDGEARLGHPLTGDHLDPGPPAEGVFAGWRWDGERLVARNDRYGVCPLFYRAGGGSLALSPDPLALLPEDGPVELDHDALAVFLRTGFFLAEDTAFAQVRALPPAATLTWDTGGLRLRSDGPPRPGAAAMTEAQAVDGFVDLFRASVARRLPGEPYDLPLSGGRDSRHILLELCRRGAPPRRCVSGAKFPPDPGADARVAAALAGRLGLPHTVVPRPRSQFPELAALPAQGMTTLLRRVDPAGPGPPAPPQPHLVRRSRRRGARPEPERGVHPGQPLRPRGPARPGGPVAGREPDRPPRGAPAEPPDERPVEQAGGAAAPRHRAGPARRQRQPAQFLLLLEPDPALHLRGSVRPGGRTGPDAHPLPRPRPLRPPRLGAAPLPGRRDVPRPGAAPGLPRARGPGVRLVGAPAARTRAGRAPTGVPAPVPRPRDGRGTGLVARPRPLPATAAGRRPGARGPAARQQAAAPGALPAAVGGPRRPKGPPPAV